MLINTVVLYLRDALPIFITLSLLANLFRIQFAEVRLLVISLGAGTLGALAVVIFADNISYLFDGAGLELFASLINITMYILISSLVLLHYTGEGSQTHLASLAFGIVFLVTSLNGGNFLVFLVGYWLNYEEARSLILGIALGLGISASFSILLWFFVGWLKNLGIRQAPYAMLLLFGAGQLAQSVNLLSQVDVIPYSRRLWNTSEIVPDNSEAGHVLSSLLGYDASPSLLQIAVNILGILLPVCAIWLVVIMQSRTPAESNGDRNG